MEPLLIAGIVLGVIVLLALIVLVARSQRRRAAPRQPGAGQAPVVQTNDTARQEPPTEPVRAQQPPAPGP